MKVSEADILRTIHKAEQEVVIGPTQEDLSKRLDISKQAMGARLARMEARGLVAKSVKGYVLTANTRARIHHIDDVIRKSDREREREAWQQYRIKNAG